MTIAQNLQRAIATPHEDAADLCAAANQTVSRCADWLERGLIFEAAALNADSGNLIGLLIRLKTGSTPVPDGLAIPPTQMLDRLARLPAIAADHRGEFAAWITANLTDAPLLDRLAAINRLHALDPTNPSWRSSHERLEHGAVAVWNDEVDRCIEEGDATSLAAAGRQADAMTLLTPGGQRLLHKIDRAQAATAREAAAAELEAVADRLHVAWAAMDFTAARRLLAEWKALDQRTNGGNEADVRGVAAWLHAETEKRRRAAHVQDLIADVVRALDELEPLGVVEQRYAALLGVADHVPAAVEARVSHRIAEGRRQRGRRYVVSILSIVAIACLITTALVVRQRSMERARTIEQLAGCMAANLEEGRLREAVDCWNEAARAAVIDAPQIAAKRAAIVRATLDLRDAEQRAVQQVVEIQAAVGEPDRSLEEIDALVKRLNELSADVPREALDVHAAALAEATSVRGTMIETLRAGIKAELTRIEQLVPERHVPVADLRAWRTRRSTLAGALDALAAIDLKGGLAGTDLSLRITRLDARLNDLLESVQSRIDQLEEVETVAAELRRIPISEATWIAAWTRLLELNPALVHDIDPNAWTEASEAGRAAQATAHWRDHVLPIVEQARLLNPDGPISAGAAARAGTTLRAHLDLYDQYTPYHDIATHLAEVASAIQSQSHRGDLRQAMSDAGLLELHRAPHATGYRYLRSENGMWLRVDSTTDLGLKPADLIAMSGDDIANLYASPAVAPMSSALQRGLDAWEQHDAPSDAAILNLITVLESGVQADELLRLAVLRAVWSAMLEQDVPMSDEVRQAATAWLESVEREAPAAAQADWPRLAQSSGEGNQVVARRQARYSAANAPQSDMIERLLTTAGQGATAQASKRVIAGILIPEPGGRLEIKLVEEALEQSEVLAHDGRQWRWVPLPPLRHGDVISPPKGVPLAPTIIFTTP
ncbi:MAG: hypothetical protein QF733_05990 [Phycisphaerales bacterium]|jgi:hypothetical protein|nr:hypothetical protein [Phycisphaerales bacterium]